MKNFKKFYEEYNVAGEGGVFGPLEPGYNDESAIVPYVIGTFTRKGKLKTKKRRKRNKRK